MITQASSEPVNKQIHFVADISSLAMIMHRWTRHIATIIINALEPTTRSVRECDDGKRSKLSKLLGERDWFWVFCLKWSIDQWADCSDILANQPQREAGSCEHEAALWLSCKPSIILAEYRINSIAVLGFTKIYESLLAWLPSISSSALACPCGSKHSTTNHGHVLLVEFLPCSVVLDVNREDWYFQSYELYSAFLGSWLQFNMKLKVNFDQIEPSTPVFESMRQAPINIRWSVISKTCRFGRC